MDKSGNYITIGKHFKVFRIGLGTNRVLNDATSKKALKTAVELGINFIDTASAYTNGVSEEIIGEVLAPYENIVIATKGGMVTPDFRIDASPQTLEVQLETSLRKLKLDTIPLYFLHRVDPNVPLKESILFLKEMQLKRKIKHIGLSQVSIKQIEEARKYVEIVAIENEFNLSARMYEDVLAYAGKENIVFIPFFPLHFDDAHYSILHSLQDKYHATPTQLSLAWLLKKSPVMLPIPGSLSVKHLKENVDVLNINFSDDDFKKIANI